MSRKPARSRAHADACATGDRCWAFQSPHRCTLTHPVRRPRPYVPSDCGEGPCQFHAPRTVKGYICTMDGRPSVRTLNLRRPRSCVPRQRRSGRALRPHRGPLHGEGARAFASRRVRPARSVKIRGRSSHGREALGCAVERTGITPLVKAGSNVAAHTDDQWTWAPLAGTVSGVAPDGADGSTDPNRVASQRFTVATVSTVVATGAGCWWLVVACSGPPTEPA